MARNRTIITQNIDEFMKSEFNFAFKNVFSEMEEFKAIMKEDVQQCKGCQTVYWKGCKPRCDCEYTKSLKIR